MERFKLYYLVSLLPLIIELGIFLIIFKLILNYFKNRNKSQIKKIDKSFYFRDIPCFKNIDIAYWLLYNYSDSNKKDINNGLIGAYILKWFKKGYIDIKTSNTILNNNYTIDLKDGNWEKTYVESKLYDFLKEVSGNNNILEKNEIQNYCSVDGNSYTIKYLFEEILKNIQENLEKQNYITVEPSKYYLLFIKTQEKVTLSNKLVNEYQNLNGLKNFLLDYSNMEEKIHIEVHLWENYLIFANLLGIADKVKKQFEKIYPNSNSVSTMFEFSNESTIIGQLNTLYKVSSLYLMYLVAIVLLLALIFWKNGKMIMPLIKLFPLIIVGGLLYFFLKKYLINKKVKEMNKTLNAKIIDVTVHYDKERDSETGREVTTKSYHYTYEYRVEGESYKGYGISNFWKSKGQKIKIYYNEIKPERSETAQEHNQFLYLFIFVFVLLVVMIYLLRDINWF